MLYTIRQFSYEGLAIVSDETVSDESNKELKAMLADVEFNAVAKDRAHYLYKYICAALAWMSDENLNGVRDAIFNLRHHVQPNIFVPIYGPMAGLCQWIEEKDEARAKRETEIFILLKKVRTMLEGEYEFHRI